jgi:hypothetical protein
MSIASYEEAYDDDDDDGAYEHEYAAAAASPSSPDGALASRIPRPSLQGKRSETAAAAAAHVSAARPVQRSRTQSTSYVVAPAPSRIPVPRGRTPSISRLNNTSLASAHSHGSLRAPSPLRDLHHHPSDLRAEPAPFTASSYTSSADRTPHSSNAALPHSAGPLAAFPDASPRPSMESEERPFEHWYRGDTARNGGVGELRVGRRQEMLDIAAYGHRARQPSSASVSRAGSARRRADSVGSGLAHRGSLYLEERERVEGGRSVLLEHPPTDVEEDGTGEEDDTGEYEYDYSYLQEYSDELEPEPQPQPVSKTTSVNTASTSSTRTATATKPSARSTGSLVAPQQSKRAGSKASKASTGAKPAAASSSSLSSPPAARTRTTSKPSTPRKAATPVSPPGRGRGGTSRGTPRGTSKRGGGTPRSTPRGAKPSSPDRERRSVGVYPAPHADDGSLADAIPTWTQPVASAGAAWDDVVLPTVARKKGLDAHFADADGSPRRPAPPAGEPEPAPGTFGFDWARYKGAGELGERAPSGSTAVPTLEEEERAVDPYADARGDATTPTPGPRLNGAAKPAPAPTPAPVPPPEQALLPPNGYPPTSPARTASPVPFAHYAAAAPSKPMAVAPPPAPAPAQTEPAEPEAGCCARCVIM